MRLTVEQLPCIIDRDVVIPCFLEDIDHPWLQRLIERASSSAGLRQGDLDEHLTAPLAISGPPAKQRLAAFTLARTLTTRIDAPAVPREVRDLLWVEAARDGSRAEALARVAHKLGITAEEVMSSLFADLPVERVVVPLSEPPSPGALAARANLWLAQAFVSRAARITFDIVGTSRNLVRNAKSKGLLCTVGGSPDGSAAILDLSGPLSLFKRTRLYGRALASLLPSLAWCDRWIVDAECVVAGRVVTFRLSTGAPILPSDPPKRFDSKVEKRFAKDFDKLRLPWTLIREPRPIVVDDSLLFPDFALERLGEPTVFIELVGFWTPAYLEQKLARYRRARLSNLILCVDEDLACAEGTMPEHARVVRFHGRVDVTTVLAAIEKGA
jgi:predicted nuclease of restriction endonuclease-like RecB superfamily